MMPRPTVAPGVISALGQAARHGKMGETHGRRGRDGQQRVRAVTGGRCRAPRCHRLRSPHRPRLAMPRHLRPATPHRPTPATPRHLRLATPRHNSLRVQPAGAPQQPALTYRSWQPGIVALRPLPFGDFITVPFKAMRFNRAVMVGGPLLLFTVSALLTGLAAVARGERQPAEPLFLLRLVHGGVRDHHRRRSSWRCCHGSSPMPSPRRSSIRAWRAACLASASP